MVTQSAKDKKLRNICFLFVCFFGACVCCRQISGVVICLMSTGDEHCSDEKANLYAAQSSKRPQTPQALQHKQMMVLV
uniref:Uncharacterized protein n=1 Tax=Rhipicephalus pulchellus TaxID=72859 RepID=L7LV38_RHIPC